VNKSRSFPWALTLVSILAIAAIVISVLPGTGLLAAPTLQDTNTPASTPTPDPCDPATTQATALEFNGIAREFDDYTAIAQNIPVQDLADSIAELQRIRRSSEDFQVPSCLATLKELQLTYMNTYINAVLTLFSINTDQQLTQEQFNEISQSVNQQIAQAFQYHEQYLDEMALIMGVTRVPSPTVPSSTQGPEGPLPEGTVTATP
jgi:hypothetical protein